MIRFILRLAFLLVFTASVLLNILALAGCFHRDLLREKDDLIDRFSRRVETLELANGELSTQLDILENTLEDFQVAHAWAAREIEKIKGRYSELGAGGETQ